MTFYTYMTRNYLNEDSPAGDLAQDMYREKETFPRNRPCKFDGWYRLIRSYLLQKNACMECLATLCKMREKTIEQKIVTAVKKAGGICPKFVSPGFDGMPDRLLLLPHGRFAFVEVKAPGEKPRPLQLARHRLLRCLGFKVYVLDSEEQIGGIIDEIRAT